MTTQASLSSDVSVAVTVVATYLLAAALYFPTTMWPRAVGGAAMAFALLYVGGVRWRGRRVIPQATLAVAFSLFALLVMPTFPAMGGRGATDSLLGLLGMQVGVLAFGVAVWEPKSPRREHLPFRTIQRGAAFAAIFLSAIATVAVIVMLFTDAASGIKLLTVYPAYFVGCAAAGAILWCFQRIDHLATGRYLAGLLGAACLYGAAAPVVALLDTRPMSLGLGLVIALGAGGVLGPAMAFDKEFP
jgi:hypothetical protein